MSSRMWILAVMGIGLVVLAAFGVLRADNDVEIERQQAISIAREVVEFEPVDVDARLLREGFAMRPVWAVSLSIPDPDGGRSDFLRHSTVELDARSGEIMRIGVDGKEVDVE